MKNKSKRLSVAIVFVLMFIVFSGSVSATSTYKEFYWSHFAHPTPLQHGLSTSENNYSVYASLEQGPGTNGYTCNGCGFYVTLELQRYTGYMTWTKVGSSKSGHVSNGHMDYFPFHTRWDNIGKYNKTMRIKITQGSKVYYSSYWVR